jgi:hypothetical protein
MTLANPMAQRNMHQLRTTTSYYPLLRFYRPDAIRSFDLSPKPLGRQPPKRGIGSPRVSWGLSHQDFAQVGLVIRRSLAACFVSSSSVYPLVGFVAMVRLGPDLTNRSYDCWCVIRMHVRQGTSRR